MDAMIERSNQQEILSQRILVEAEAESLTLKSKRLARRCEGRWRHIESPTDDRSELRRHVPSRAHKVRQAR